MVTRLGIIGLSPQNGHPYSFSAIINGFNETAMQDSGWIGILRYLKKADPSEVGFKDAKITHVWTQDPNLSRSVSKACLISNIATDFREMAKDVDGVIIARDDYETHLEMARPFLEKGIPVFVDKPLTLKDSEMHFYEPFLEKGLLMSCSGLRYATELDAIRENPEKLIGKLQGVSCGVINRWGKYGIHMLDAILGIYPNLNPSRMVRHPSQGDAITIETTDGETLSIFCLGGDAPVFSMNFYGSEGMFSANISNNFGAFRRTMRHFVNQVKSGNPSIPPELTQLSMKIMTTGANLEQGEIFEFSKS
jgi:hypothetical protein